jgi:hypothetical protein
MRSVSPLLDGTSDRFWMMFETQFWLENRFFRFLVGIAIRQQLSCAQLPTL